jgi:hypothetical protein
MGFAAKYARRTVDPWIGVAKVTSDPLKYLSLLTT